MSPMDATFVLSFMCGGFVVVFLIMFLAIMLWRWFKHRETMAMIQQGLVPPAEIKKRNGNGNGGSKALLAWGVGIIFFGFAVLAAMGLATAFVFSSPYQPAGPPTAVFLIPGLFVTLMGFALLTIYLVTRPTKNGQPNGANSSGDQAEGKGSQFPDR